MIKFINMLRNKRGASAAEYALILAIIGAVIAIAALGLADAIGNAMDETAACIDNPSRGRVQPANCLGRPRVSRPPPNFLPGVFGQSCV